MLLLTVNGIKLADFFCVHGVTKINFVLIKMFARMILRGPCSLSLTLLGNRGCLNYISHNGGNDGK